MGELAELAASCHRHLMVQWDSEMISPQLKTTKAAFRLQKAAFIRWISQ
ncbi:MAG: hypothetical protein M3443_11800 [Actinomycetota bacterium]|nr:hypothetical protein [Actinomycetota bacterium]